MTSHDAGRYAAGAAKDCQVIDVFAEADDSRAKWVDLTNIGGPIEGLNLLQGASGMQSRTPGVCASEPGCPMACPDDGVGGRRDGQRGKGSVYRFCPAAGEIKRVKGLGCLQDKRYPDRFNVRVITHNGKITSEEQRRIASGPAVWRRQGSR